MAQTALSFELCTEHLADAVLLLDPSGVIIWANLAAGQAAGRPSGCLRGLDLCALLTPRSAEEAELALHSLRDRNEGQPLLELDFVRPDLTAARLEVDLSWLRGSPLIMAVARDLSRRRELGEIRQAAEFQALQFQAALAELAGAESGSLKDSLARITEVGAAALDVARVGVWLFNNERTEIQCVHLFDRERNVHESGAVIEVRQHPGYFDAVEQLRAIAVEDICTEPATATLAADRLVARNTRATLDVPVHREGRTVGILCHEQTSTPRKWRLDERNFAASLADLTALVLETDRRHQAEGELRRSLDQLEMFFSQSLDGFFFMMLDEPVRWDDTVEKEQVLDYVMDHQRVTKTNDALLRQYGASREEFIGVTPGQLFSHDIAHGRDLWRRMLDAGRLHVESDERRADGSRMWVEGDYICFYDSEGRITGHFGIQRDVSERKRAEQTLKRYNRRLALLQHIDRAILSANSAQEIARAALAHVDELIPCRRASVVEFDLQAGRARVAGVYHLGATKVDSDLVLPLEIFGNLNDLRLGKPHIVTDPDSPILSRLRDEGIRLLVSVPMLADGVLIGSLNLGSDTSEMFSQEDLEIAREVADSLAVATRHAQLNEQIARHAAELEKRVEERTAELSSANASLRDSEERLAGIFRSAMDAILVIDSRKDIVIFNQAAEKVFRCPANAAQGRSIHSFLSDDAMTLLDNYMAGRGAEQTGPLWVTGGLRAIRNNGELFPIEATISRAELSSGTLYSIILRDINERKESEERLEQLWRQNVYLQQEIQHELNFEEIVGASPAMLRVFNSIEMVAATDSTVLLLGETGTGKELIARAVHNRSRRRQSVMVKVNCGALPANLVESELFGHERGAFTGALTQKKGRFELANRGTIFLDEVGELPLDTQTKLLRVLQEHELERVGGSQTIKVDVRVIAATNRNLAEEVKRGAFRADLYYRLNVFPLEVPPLRNRKEDIPLLAAYFVRKFSERMGKRIQSISRDVYDRMQRYDWPGNVREVANLMERAVILCQGSVLQAAHLTVGDATPPANTSENRFPTLEESERQLIVEALDRTGGVLAGPAGAANLLGINRSTLWSRMRKLGIALPKSKSADTSGKTR